MLAAGQRVGAYSIIKFIATGGTGDIYLARGPVGTPQQADLPVCALKLLREDLAHNPVFQARLYNEALGFADLDIAGIARVFDHGEHAGRPFIVLEYLPGGSLAERQRPMPLAAALSIGVALATTLVALHERGIVHRDLKPHNVLFDAAGQPKLSDFGLAKNERAKIEGLVIPHSTETGAFLGTRAYAAPEQLLNAKAVTSSADLYSLGVLLFELLTGTLPVSGEELEDVETLTREPPLLSARFPTAPPDLTALIARLLSRRPAARPSAAEVVAVLSRIQPARPRGRHRLSLALLPLLLLPPQPPMAARLRLELAYSALEDDLHNQTIAAARADLDLAAQLLTADGAASASARARHGYKQADLAKAQGHLQEAALGYEASLAALRDQAQTRGTDDDHRRLASCADELGDVLLHLGQLDRAQALFQEAERHQKILLTNQPQNVRPQFVYTQFRFAQVYRERGDLLKEQEALQSTWDVLPARGGHQDTWLYRVRVAERLVELTSGPRAATYAQEAYRTARETWLRYPRARRHRLAYLRAAERLGEHGGAAALLDEALAGKRLLWQVDPAHGLWAHELLESLLRRLRREPKRRDLIGEAQEVLASIRDRGQWVGDVHVAAWRKTLGALDPSGYSVIPQ